MSRQILPNITPSDWESQKPGSNSGEQRTRFLQKVNNVIQRPVLNRASAATSVSGITVTLNAAAQSTGIGTIAMQPKSYGEFTVKARVTFAVNSVGPAYVLVYRTLGAIPANGAAPNVGDVVVGGDSFAGGAMTSGVFEIGTFSFLDIGLDVTKSYRFYIAVLGPNGNTLSLKNSSQVLVMERS